MAACMHAAMQESKKLGNSVKRAPSPAEKEPLQVRIPMPVKRAFKSRAALMGLEPNQLFVQVWDHYLKTHTTAALRDK